MKTIRVLNIAPLASKIGAYGGPFETTVAQAELCSGNIEVVVLAPHLRGDMPSISKGFTFVSPRLRRYSGKNNFWVTFSIGSAVTAFREIRRSAIVHLSFSRELFPIFCAAISLILRKKLILQSHGMLTSRFGISQSVVDVIVKPIFKAANLRIALTPTEKSELLDWCRVESASIQVIGNPIPRLIIGKHHGSAFNRNIVSFIARLHPRKRLLDFLDAAVIVRKKSEKIRFIFAGPDQGDLSLSKPFVEADFAEYAGSLSQENVQKLLARSKVFVLCSENEPWGNVLVTALALGVPVVVTESSHLSGLVRDFGAGLAVPDRNPLSLAQAIEKIIELDQNEYEILKENAVRLATQVLGNDAIRAALLRAYNHVT